jgi:hypothetical protein
MESADYQMISPGFPNKIYTEDENIFRCDLFGWTRLQGQIYFEQL